MAIEVFDYFAVQYQDKFMDLDLYHDSLDKFCEAIKKKNAEVIELACGPGNITKYLLGKRPDFKILATDLSTKMIELAKANNPRAEFQIMDCRDIDKINKRFDALICGFGLPYISKEDAIKLISNASKILSSDGILYLSTMEDDYNKSGLKPSSSGEKMAYIHYHQADYLTNALHENCFEIIDLSRNDYLEANGIITKDLLIVARLRGNK